MSAPPLTRGRRMVRALAWGAIVASFPVWFAAFLVVPFLPLSAAARTGLAAACIAAGEALFWGAGFVLGAEVIARFRPPRVDTGKSLAGRRVAVLGATGGLGEAVARAVSREGGELVALGRDGARLERLAGELSARAIVTDLHPASLRAAAEACGPVDHLVCATGFDVRRSLFAHDDDDVRDQVDVALTGPIHVARTFLPTLLPRGTVALFGGFADGTLALPYYSVDVAARAGLAGFCAAVNRELAVEGRDVRLCYLCPAPADTAAERPFAALWRQLGSVPVAPQAVAGFVLQSLLMRRTVAVMGRSTRALVWLQRLAPWAVEWLVVRRLGPPLRAAFGVPAATMSQEMTRGR